MGSPFVVAAVVAACNRPAADVATVVRNRTEAVLRNRTDAVDRRLDSRPSSAAWGLGIV